MPLPHAVEGVTRSDSDERRLARRIPTAATMPAGGSMPTIEGDYVTIAEAAAILDVSEGAVRVAISRGTLRGEPIQGLPRVKVIARAEVDRYKRERAERGWDKRRERGTEQSPSKAAQRVRAYRERKKAAVTSANLPPMALADRRDESKA